MKDERGPIDHDSIFKRLIGSFYPDFVQLFFPAFAETIDWATSSLLDKEFLGKSNVQRKGEKQFADLAVIAKEKGSNSLLVIHIEVQEQRKLLRQFPHRMFKYTMALHEKYKISVFPVVLFTFEQPKDLQPCQYQMSCNSLVILDFRFNVVQLNRLNWNDFAYIRNPIAAALMAKMPIDQADRARVKLRCLNLLQGLLLDDEKRELIGEFIDLYLELSPKENQEFELLLERSKPEEREGVRKMVTSWKREGIAQGKAEGIEQGKAEGLEQGKAEGLEQGKAEGLVEGKLTLILKLLKKRFGDVDHLLLDQTKNLKPADLDALAEALLDFTNANDLRDWLQSHSSSDT